MKEEDFIGLAGNAEFVNRLEGCVKQWLKDIARVTQMKYDLTSGSVLQEIMFHISLERSLTHIKEQIEKPEVKMTFDLLKGADKNKLILMFTHDLELDSVLKTVQGYNRVLREVPINNLLSANDLAQINVALTKIFEQVRNMRNQEQIYPKPRQL
jgi:dynein heavy chain 1, cytosolic